MYNLLLYQRTILEITTDVAFAVVVAHLKQGRDTDQQSLVVALVADTKNHSVNKQKQL